MSKSDLLFLLALATIPIQLNKYFFFDFSYIFGLPIDYRAVAIYFSDLIIISYLTFFLKENFSKFKIKKFILSQKWVFLIILTLDFYLIINSTVTSQDHLVSIVFTIKIIFLSLFATFATVSLSKATIFEKSRKILTFSLIWQSAVIILQFLLQRSLGFWFLGERVFDSSTVSIAHSQILGHQFLRPYGTFPHPNLAAAFFVVSLIFVTQSKLTSFKLSKFKLTLLLSVVAILLTFSKAAILALISTQIVRNLKRKYVLILVPFLIILLLIAFKLLPDPQVATFAERLTLQKTALDITKTYPTFGVGSANFILELSKFNLFYPAEIRLLQPVHNVFLLILAENGIIGLMIFIIFLIVVLKHAVTPAKIALFIALLLFSSVDHFLWTLQQGQLLFWFTIGYILSKDQTRTF